MTDILGALCGYGIVAARRCHRSSGSDGIAHDPIATRAIGSDPFPIFTGSLLEQLVEKPEVPGSTPSLNRVLLARHGAGGTLDGTDERSLRRALIQHLLAGQLDPSLMNDAQFQQMVTRVTEAIEDDREASQLMTRVLADLKPS